MIEEIRATAKVSFKQITRAGDVFYTFEYGQSRTPDNTLSIEENNNLLWEAVHNEVNNQIAEVKNMYNKQ